MKVGIIGSGFGLYGLLPAFNSIDNCKVTCICGKKTERLLNYCKSIGLENIYSDWSIMLENEDLDAIAVAVTPSAQYEIAKVAMEKGLHVFAEKPLSANYIQAKELLLLARKKKIITAVDFIFPEIDEWQKVKQLLEDKVYGNLQNILVSWDFLSYDYKNKISSWKSDITKGGGALSFYLSHTLYYLEYFVGEISKAKSLFSYSDIKSKSRGESGVDLLLKFKNGVNGQVHFSSAAVGIQKHQITFMCEKATIVLESNKGVTENFTLKIYNQEKEKQIIVKNKKISKNDEDERVCVVKKLASRFVDGCRNRTQIVPSFVEGVRVQKLIDIIRAEKI